MIRRVCRPDPTAPTKGELKTYLVEFDNKLDALCSWRIKKAPRRLRTVLHAARRAGADLRGRPRPEITQAATAAAIRELLRLQLRPYQCPRCKKTGASNCQMCGGRGLVQWDGDVNGGPR